MSERHSMVWNSLRASYGCSCGPGVLYEGGEKKARVQHRAHKAGIPTSEQVLSVLKECVEALERLSDGGNDPGYVARVAQRALAHAREVMPK